MFSGVFQCSVPHFDVYAGSTAMTAIPAFAAIAAMRSRNCPVGMFATVRRNCLPRLPRPIVSRPVVRASAKFRFSIVIDAHPLVYARRISCETASRSRPSRVAAGLPVKSTSILCGSPIGLPSGPTTHTARCPAFMSTPSVRLRCKISSPTVAAGACDPRRVEIPAASASVVRDLVRDSTRRRCGLPTLRVCG